MKMTKVAFLALILLLPSLIACAGKVQNTSDKVDLRFKQAVEDATKDSNLEKLLECIIKLNEKPTEGEKHTLTDNGFIIRSVIGKILTGRVAAKDVYKVADLPFVQAMELAVPVSLKKQK